MNFELFLEPCNVYEIRNLEIQLGAVGNPVIFRNVSMLRDHYDLPHDYPAELQVFHLDQCPPGIFSFLFSNYCSMEKYFSISKNRLDKCVFIGLKIKAVSHKTLYGDCKRRNL